MSLFMGPLVPLFWITAVTPLGFKARVIFSHCRGECNVHPLRAPLHDTAMVPAPSTVPYGIQWCRGAIGTEPIDKWCCWWCQRRWRHRHLCHWCVNGLKDFNATYFHGAGAGAVSCKWCLRSTSIATCCQPPGCGAAMMAHSHQIICSRLSNWTAKNWVRHPLLPTVWSQSDRTVGSKFI